MSTKVKSLDVTDTLKEALNKIDNIEDYHQTIMNIAYDHLNSLEDPNKLHTYNVEGWRPNRPWSHSLLCWSTKGAFGELAEFAVMIGKYNQQVCNGGHHQYWWNHYASDNDITEDIYLHIKLEELFEAFTVDIESEIELSDEDRYILRTVSNIMSNFKEFLELKPRYVGKNFISDEYGEIYEFDSEEESSDFGEITENCKYGWDKLDGEYYQVNEKLMNLLEMYFNKKVNKQ